MAVCLKQKQNVAIERIMKWKSFSSLLLDFYFMKVRVLTTLYCHFCTTWVEFKMNEGKIDRKEAVSCSWSNFRGRENGMNRETLQRE